MAADVRTVSSAIVTAINDANIFTADAAFTHYPDANLDELETERIDVFIDEGKTKTRINRAQVKVTQNYGVMIRKRFDSADLSGAVVAQAAIDDYLSKSDDIEDLLWRGRISAVEAATDSMEVVTSFTTDELNQYCLFKYVIRFTCSWVINK